MAEESKVETGAGAPNADFRRRPVVGRHVLITGGTKGIGKNLAASLAAAGAKVIICGRSATAAAEVAAELNAKEGDGSVEGLGCDVSDLASIKAMVSHIAEKYTHLDVVVNNAAIMPGFSMDPCDVDDALDLATFQINLTGSHFVTKYTLPLLFAQPDPAEFERTVLYTTSDAGWLTEPRDGFGMLAYRATKAGQHGTMVGLHELYGKPIEEDTWKVRAGDKNKVIPRIAAVHPGVVATSLGHETPGGADVSDLDAFAASKTAFGAIPVSEGADTLLWAICAQNGVVQSGKHYYLRDVHSF